MINNKEFHEIKMCLYLLDGIDFIQKLKKENIKEIEKTKEKYFISNWKTQERQLEDDFIRMKTYLEEGEGKYEEIQDTEVTKFIKELFNKKIDFKIALLYGRGKAIKLNYFGFEIFICFKHTSQIDKIKAKEDNSKEWRQIEKDLNFADPINFLKDTEQLKFKIKLKTGGYNVKG